jgi:hypothetical protein
MFKEKSKSIWSGDSQRLLEDISLLQELLSQLLVCLTTATTFPPPPRFMQLLLFFLFAESSQIWCFAGSSQTGDSQVCSSKQQVFLNGYSTVLFVFLFFTRISFDSGSAKKPVLVLVEHLAILPVISLLWKKTAIVDKADTPASVVYDICSPVVIGFFPCFLNSCFLLVNCWVTPTNTCWRFEVMCGTKAIFLGLSLELWSFMKVFLKIRRLASWHL